MEQTGLEFVAEGAEEFQSAVDDASEAVGNFEKAGASTADSFNAFEEVVTGALRKVGEVAIDMAINAGQAIVGFAQDSFTGALEAEKGLTRLRGAIKRAGDQAPITEEQALALADSLKGLAGGSDDAVIAAQAALLKFQQIGEDTFPQALQTSLDLAAVLGTDAASAAEQLGRALGNPEQAARLLRQAGVFLTDSEKEQIKTFTEAGDAASAQQLILDKLTATTAGAAADMAGTVGGQMAIFKETIADAGEQIATAFLPALQTLFESVIKPNIPTIEAIAEAFANLVSGLLSFEDPVGDVANLFWELANAFGFSKEQSTAVFDSVIGLRDGFDELMSAFSNLGNAFMSQWPEMQRIGSDFMIWLQNAFGDTFPQLFDNVIIIINSLADIWREHGDEIMQVVEIAFKFVVATILGALNLITGIIAATLQLVRGDWVGAFNTIGETLESFFNTALSIVGTNMTEFRAVWAENFQMLGIIASHVINSIADGVLNSIGSFINAGQQLITGLAQGIRDGWGLVVGTVQDIIQAAINNALNVFGIGSPSKVTADMVGAPLGEGIAQGILGTIGEIKAAMSGVAFGGVVAPAAGGYAMGSSVSNSSTQSWNLNVNSNQSSQGIISDFAIMQALA